MKNVLVVQIDNRDLDYLGLTKKLSKIQCKHLSEVEYTKDTKYHYMFLEMNPYLKSGMYPATSKIYAIYDLLQITQCDVIVFLDSDAWIQEPKYLHLLVMKIVDTNNSYQGAFSRDPYIKKNTYINSGSFVIAVNDYTRNMYKMIIDDMKTDKSHWWKHAYDQYYISKYVYNNKTDFMVFKPEIVNTPCGRIIRHNWWKTHKMYRDLYDLVDENHTISVLNPDETFDFEVEMDDQPYPNPIEEGYEYWM
jgi:hypothetical protein